MSLGVKGLIKYADPMHFLIFSAHYTAYVNDQLTISCLWILDYLEALIFFPQRNMSGLHVLLLALRMWFQFYKVVSLFVCLFVCLFLQ